MVVERKIVTNNWPILFNHNFCWTCPVIVKLLLIILNERKFGMTGKGDILPLLTKMVALSTDLSLYILQFSNKKGHHYIGMAKSGRI